MKMDKLKTYLKETLLTEEEISKIVDNLAEKLNEEYADKKEPIVVIGLLKGAIMFTCDLYRKLNFPSSLDFFWATSYVGSASTHKLNIRKDIDEDVEGKHIILLDDSVNTATSLKVIIEKLKELETTDLIQSRRIVTEHLRSSMMIINDGGSSNIIGQA